MRGGKNAFWQLGATAVVILTAAYSASAHSLTDFMRIERAADTTAGSTPAELRGTSWQWVGVTSPVESFTVDQPDRYTLSFVEGNKVVLRADCNRGTGPVASPSPGALEIGPLAMTRARCPPGSLSDRFARDVSRAVRFAIRGSELLVELQTDAGILHFARRL
jgi:para-nitrobenzyl esterase